MPLDDRGRADRADVPAADASHAARGRFRGRVIAWVAVIAAVVLIGLPTALLFGLGDALADGPRKGLVTFVGTIVLVGILLAISFAWEQLKERRRSRRHHQDD